MWLLILWGVLFAHAEGPEPTLTVNESLGKATLLSDPLQGPPDKNSVTIPYSKAEKNFRFTLPPLEMIPPWIVQAAFRAVPGETPLFPDPVQVFEKQAKDVQELLENLIKTLKRNSGQWDTWSIEERTQRLQSWVWLVPDSIGTKLLDAIREGKSFNTVESRFWNLYILHVQALTSVLKVAQEELRYLDTDTFLNKDNAAFNEVFLYYYGQGVDPDEMMYVWQSYPILAQYWVDLWFHLNPDTSFGDAYQLTFYMSPQTIEGMFYQKRIAPTLMRAGILYYKLRYALKERITDGYDPNSGRLTLLAEENLAQLERLQKLSKEYLDMLRGFEKDAPHLFKFDEAYQIILEQGHLGSLDSDREKAEMKKLHPVFGNANGWLDRSKVILGKVAQGITKTVNGFYSGIFSAGEGLTLYAESNFKAYGTRSFFQDFINNWRSYYCSELWWGQIPDWTIALDPFSTREEKKWILSHTNRSIDSFCKPYIERVHNGTAYSPASDELAELLYQRNIEYQKVFSSSWLGKRDEFSKVTGWNLFYQTTFFPIFQLSHPFDPIFQLTEWTFDSSMMKVSGHTPGEYAKLVENDFLYKNVKRGFFAAEFVLAMVLTRKIQGRTGVPQLSNSVELSRLAETGTSFRSLALRQQLGVGMRLGKDFVDVARAPATALGLSGLFSYGFELNHSSKEKRPFSIVKLMDGTLSSAAGSMQFMVGIAGASRAMRFLGTPQAHILRMSNSIDIMEGSGDIPETIKIFQEAKNSKERNAGWIVGLGNLIDSGDSAFAVGEKADLHALMKEEAQRLQLQKDVDDSILADQRNRAVSDLTNMQRVKNLWFVLTALKRPLSTKEWEALELLPEFNESTRPFLENAGFSESEVTVLIKLREG